MLEKFWIKKKGKVNGKGKSKERMEKRKLQEYIDKKVISYEDHN